MIVNFATCERKRALEYLCSVYPSSTVADTPEDAGPMLDLVEADIIRVQDPMMYGRRIQITPGTHWVEDADERARITSICSEFHDKH